jgi:opine dehydrogenase
MGSLSSLYLFETAHSLGLNLRIASFGTTVLTARRKHAAQVHVTTKRAIVPMSCLPLRDLPKALEICRMLFGDVFTPEDNSLVTTLANANPISHVPLALFNWTRIERAECWPQFHYMTPHVSMVIEKLDAERMAVANAFGISVANVSQHLSRSFNVSEPHLAGIAAELHKRRGGPPGPIDVETRYLSEDVPFGLVFLRALGGIAQVPVPVTTALIDMSSFIVGVDFSAGNDLISTMGLSSESVDGLLARANNAGIG